MRYTPIALGAIITWTMALCADIAIAEPLIQRSFEISNIQEVEASGHGLIQLSLGDTESLEVIAPASIIKKIKIDANSGTLRIQQKGGFWSWVKGDSSQKQQVTYKLTLKSISALIASHGVNIEVLSPIHSDNFTMTLSGAAKAQIKALTVKQSFNLECSGAAEVKLDSLNASTLNVQGSGASVIDISGKAAEQHIDLGGASSYHANDLHSQRVTANASGASELQIWVEDLLEGEISGASHLEYSGNPKRSITSTGASDISNKGTKSPTSKAS